MSEAIFLSASVPDPRQAPDYAKSADTVAITAAVTALVYVTLGRRLLVWGGHPAITPMVLIVAESMGVDYGKWVKLYQSKLFEEDFPEENKRFQNLNLTEVVDDDREKSLRHMRERMFRENQFHAAVFIGGMGGVLDEFSLFKDLQPAAETIPLLSTGGAVLELSAREHITFPADFSKDFDYVSLFHRYLHIDKREMRFSNPEEQPKAQNERLWAYQTKK
ncbi:hypothetical protein [Pseudorhodoplanes sp.]|uniref:SLOG domain-containing protein n=1 Tax=Pseudorhodoplanes sp. TaxID=1934341 RepID=UPI003D0F81A2